MTSADKMEDKFEFLKNAPKAANFIKEMKVTYQPMGIQLRNVKCMRCGEWGHSSGDRECSLRDHNPNDLFRMRVEDPLCRIISQQTKPEILRDSLYVFEKPSERIGGANADDPNQQYVHSEEEEDVEKEFIDSLTPSQKKILRKYLEQEGSAFESKLDSGEKKRKKKEKKRDKKSKKRKKDVSEK